MRFKLVLSIIAATLTVPTAHAAPHPNPEPTPGWMAGAWIETKGDQWSDEYWTPMRGGIMIGAARIGKGETLQVWEATRIERGSDGKLTFWASPRGVTPSAFPVVAQSSTMIEFANPVHDYPQRIRYWREGEMLNAEISLIDGSKPMRWRYRPVSAN